MASTASTAIRSMRAVSMAWAAAASGLSRALTQPCGRTEAGTREAGWGGGDGSFEVKFGHAPVEPSREFLGAGLGLSGREAAGPPGSLVLPDLGSTPVPVVDLVLKTLADETCRLVDTLVDPCRHLFDVAPGDRGGSVLDDALAEVGRLAPLLAEYRLRGLSFRVRGRFEVRDRRLRERDDRAIGVHADVLDAAGDDLRASG